MIRCKAAFAVVLFLFVSPSFGQSVPGIPQGMLIGPSFSVGPSVYMGSLPSGFTAGLGLGYRISGVVAGEVFGTMMQAGLTYDNREVVFKTETPKWKGDYNLFYLGVTPAVQISIVKVGFDMLIPMGGSVIIDADTGKANLNVTNAAFLFALTLGYDYLLTETSDGPFYLNAILSYPFTHPLSDGPPPQSSGTIPTLQIGITYFFGLKSLGL
jgi:hypothetical protein